MAQMEEREKKNSNFITIKISMFCACIFQFNDEIENKNEPTTQILRDLCIVIMVYAVMFEVEIFFLSKNSMRSTVRVSVCAMVDDLMMIEKLKIEQEK